MSNTIDFNCPGCQQLLEAPPESAGLKLPCPGCGLEVQVPPAFVAPAPVAPPPKPITSLASLKMMKPDTPATPPRVTSPAPPPPPPPVAPFTPPPTSVASPDAVRCGICLSPIAQAEAKQNCSACNAVYHAECWEENAGCAVYGCSQVPAVELRRAVEIPVSYWGQENKQCPGCGQQILAAAVRCRYCGATFESARPQVTEEFRRQTDLSARLPAVKKKVVWLFIFCLLPCLAPIGAIWGLIWYPANRDDLHALPAIYGALCKIGLIVAIGQTVAVVVATVLFTFFRG